MGTSADPNVPELKSAGDTIATKLWLYVNPQRTDWHSWSFIESRGDGTVPVWSAVNNFETLADSEPSFAEHSTIFEDKWLQNRLARVLVGGPPPVKAELAEEISTRDGIRHLGLLRVAADPALLPPGETMRVKVTLEFSDNVSPGSIEVSASVHGLPSAKMTESTTGDDAAVRRLAFFSDVQAPGVEGTFRIDVYLPGKDPIATYAIADKDANAEHQ